MGKMKDRPESTEFFSFGEPSCTVSSNPVKGTVSHSEEFDLNIVTASLWASLVNGEEILRLFLKPFSMIGFGY